MPDPQSPPILPIPGVPQEPPSGDAIQKWLETPDPDPVIAGATAPRSDAASKAEAQARFSEQKPQNYRSNLIFYNQASDVPLDIDTGANWWQRVKASFRHDPAEQVKFWQDLYGAGNVRPAQFQGRATGGLIVRTLDETTGKPKDVLVDENQFSLKDIGELAGGAPELAGAIIATTIGKRALPMAGRGGILKGMRDVVAISIGSETVGGLKDKAVSMADQTQLSLADAMSKRAREIPGDIVAGALLGLAGKGVAKAWTPFGEGPPVTEAGKKAAEYFKNKYGEELVYTTGEKTGSSIIQRTEMEMKRLPGGSGAYAGLGAEQQGVFQRIMDRVRGLTPGATAVERAAVPTEEQIGREAMLEIQAHNESLDTAISNSRYRLIGNYQRQIEQTINAATGPARQLYGDDIGNAVKLKAQALRDDFKNQSSQLYDAAMTLPGGKDRILIAPDLATKAADYLKNELPPKTVITTTPTGLVNAQGVPVVRTSAGQEIADKFVPSGVIDKLKQLSETGATKWSLQDLIAMRNEVSNDIAQNESIPGVQTHHLFKIRDMLTDAIKDSTGNLPGGQLRAAWEAANKHYADNVQKFHTKLVSTMLRDPGAPGAVSADTLVDRILSNSDNILEAKTLLGASSPEYTMLRRGVADRVLSESAYPGTTIIEGRALVRDLSSMKDKNRRLFDEVFGAWGDKAIKQGMEMGLGQGDLSGVEKQLFKGAANADTLTLAAALRDPAHAPLLTDLISAERAKEKAYANQLREWIGSGTIPGDISPSQVVPRLMKNASISEAGEFMTLLNSNPQLQARVSAKVVENLLSAAERAPTANDVVALRLDHDRMINSEKLLQLLGDSEKQQVYEKLLGPDKFEDLVNLAKAVRPIEAKQAEFQAAGGIAGGMAVSGFLRGNILQFFSKATRHLLISSLLTAKPTRSWLENTALSNNGAQNLITATITSEPFWETLVDEYGKAGAQRMMGYLQGGQQGATQRLQTQQPTGSGVGDEEIDKFLKK